MNRTRKRRLLRTVLILLLVFIGIPAWLIYREVRQQNLDHALIEAIYNYDTKAALAALDAGAGANARDIDQQYVSLWEKAGNLFKRMLGQKAQETREDRPTALQIAVEQNLEIRTEYYNKFKLIQALLDKGADASVRDKQGNTPLNYAMGEPGHSDMETIRLLLDHGADVNAKDQFGSAPLMTAAANDDEQMVRLLLAHGADVRLKDSNGKTAWNYATAHNAYRTKNLLTQAGAQE